MTRRRQQRRTCELDTGRSAASRQLRPAVAARTFAMFGRPAVVRGGGQKAGSAREREVKFSVDNRGAWGSDRSRMVAEALSSAL